MNEREGPGGSGSEPDGGTPGPNLKLLYSVIGLALMVAIAIAAMIVLPFYQRR